MTSRSAVALAFAASMALAGFMLFQVQLVLGKFILPWFGGSASTWLVCLMFFQVALLAGYTHAYVITQPFAIRAQVRLHLVVVAASLLLLPVAPSEVWKPVDAGDPTWRIVGLLAASVGVPYVVLAATTPLLSRWLAHVAPDLDPVRFFAASNAGSSLGLLSYPFVVERLLTTASQARMWSWLYGGFAVLVALCGAMTVRSRAVHPPHETELLPPSKPGRDPLAALILYSALGSVLLLATTNAITQWSAVVPFLWMVPLCAYLLTFVITFGYPQAYHRMAYAGAFLVLAGTTFLLPIPTLSIELIAQLTLHTATLFAGCMICHAELVRLRPSPARLPRFYLAIAAGGAAGGMFVTLLAPAAFSDYFEQPLVLSVIAGIAFLNLLPGRPAARSAWIAGAVASAAAIYFAGSLAVGVYGMLAPESLVERVRNFYGVVKVLKRYEGEPKELSLVLMQAGIDQGGQFQSPERELRLICGFNEESGLGLALGYHAKRRNATQQGPLRIGIVGLGAGMIAGLGRDGDSIRYYELNPAVLDLATRHFTFLKKSKAKTDFLLGDGRLLLERQLAANDKQNFDVLVMNAFRGASPPMHLMTKEAFAIYFAHLARDGILAVNFEIDTFDTSPLHRGMAKQFGTHVRWFETPEDDDCVGPISWALYSRDASFFEAPVVRRAISPWRDRSNSELVWTDNDSNLMSIINLRFE
jgi:hypothetical protein